MDMAFLIIGFQFITFVRFLQSILKQCPWNQWFF